MTYPARDWDINAELIDIAALAPGFEALPLTMATCLVDRSHRARVDSQPVGPETRG